MSENWQETKLNDKKLHVINNLKIFPPVCRELGGEKEGKEKVRESCDQERKRKKVVIRRESKNLFDIGSSPLFLNSSLRQVLHTNQCLETS